MDFKELYSSLGYGRFVQKATAPVGEIHEWKGGRYQKQADGSWKKLIEERTDVSLKNIKVPEHYDVYHKNQNFSMAEDEVLLAHSTPEKNLKSIKDKGLVHGTGKPGQVGSAGSTDLWAWYDPQKAIDSIHSSGQGVVLFAVNKKDIVKIPDSNAVYIKSGVVPVDKIATILNVKGKGK